MLLVHLLVSDKKKLSRCLEKLKTFTSLIELKDCTEIDYLQLDCDPPVITYKILLKIPFDKVKFGVITYEHDHYNDITNSYRVPYHSSHSNRAGPNNPKTQQAGTRMHQNQRKTILGK